MHVRPLVCLALVVGGCSPSRPGAGVSCSPPECPADTTLQLVAEVEPPSGSPFVRQEFDVVGIDAKSGLFALALDPEVTLSGVVQIASGTSLQPVAATVVATRPSRIPGRPDVYYQSAVDPTNGAYSLMVSQNRGANEHYVVRVTATDTSLVPPKTVPVTASEDQSVDLTFEDPLTLPEVHGTIVDSLQMPVPGMQVQATVPSDPTNPNAATLVVSTTTTTDDSGAYSLRLVKNPPATVRLTAVPTSSATPQLPSLTLDVSTAKLSATNSLSASLRVPPLPAPAHVIYTVVGTGPSGAQMPAVAASCVFAADVSDPHAVEGTHASYRTSSTTDALGQATVDLIPIDRPYSVTLTPDAPSIFGAATTTVTVAPGVGYGPMITLPLRPQLSGRTLDPQGKPLRNVIVVPGASTVLASLGGATPFATGALTPPQALADVDGRFALRLDPGTWDIGLIPPADSMLPRLWIAGVDVQANLDLAAGLPNDAITIPRGVMVHGVVHDPSGNALARANVRLYTVAAGNAACTGSDKNSCLQPPRLRAEGSSDGGGVVAVILPSQPD